MSEPVSNDKVRQMIESPEMRARVDDPKTEQQVKAGFEEAASKVRGRLGDVWQDVQDIYHMAFDKDFTMEPRVKYVAIGALVYLVLPIDLVPDPIPLVGVVDDLAALAFAVKYAKPEIERYRAYKASRGSGGTGAT
jgi:uncharacterized membrane protein YkvA (DUF1232 family)